MLKKIKQADPRVVTIWVKRGEYAQAIPQVHGFQPDKEMIDLKEIVEIIHTK